MIIVELNYKDSSPLLVACRYIMKKRKYHRTGG